MRRVLISAPAIRRRIRQLALRIASDHKGDQPILLGILQASFMFMADLSRALPPGIRIDWIGASSYGDGTRPGPVRITSRPTRSIRGQRVVVVDTIVDTGRTLRKVLAWVRSHRPRSVSVCALLHKRGCAKIDYLGFRIPDRFVVGYGLDHGGRHRNLAHIKVIDG